MMNSTRLEKFIPEKWIGIFRIQMSGCGATDINDLITNTIGACIGYGVYKVMEKYIPEKRIGVFRISGWNGYFELIGFWLGTVIMMLAVQPLLFHRFFR